MTAKMGAAAKPICSADWAAKFDHASQRKAVGKGLGACFGMGRFRDCIECNVGGTLPYRTPLLALEFRFVECRGKINGAAMLLRRSPRRGWFDTARVSRARGASAGG